MKIFINSHTPSQLVESTRGRRPTACVRWLDRFNDANKTLKWLCSRERVQFQAFAESERVLWFVINWDYKLFSLAGGGEKQLSFIGMERRFTWRWKIERLSVGRILLGCPGEQRERHNEPNVCMESSNRRRRKRSRETHTLHMTEEILLGKLIAS